MLRKLVEVQTGPMPDSDFRATLDMATTDIKVNHVDFGVKTPFRDVVQIAVLCYGIVRGTKKTA